MLFTEVTLEVDRELLGFADRLVELRVAGGDDGETRATVHGLPTFELGKTYLLFLQPRFAVRGDPVVGGDQGFFEVVRADGQEYLLDAGGDIVVGVEGDRVVSRRHPGRVNGPGPRPGPLPVPGPGFEVRVSISAEAARPSSLAPPMALDDFIAALRLAREEVR